MQNAECRIKGSAVGDGALDVPLEPTIYNRTCNARPNIIRGEATPSPFPFSPFPFKFTYLTNPYVGVIIKSSYKWGKTDEKGKNNGASPR